MANVAVGNPYAPNAITATEVFYNIRQHQTRLLVQPRHRPRYTAHRVRSRGLMSAVPRLARKHGLAAESRRLHSAQHSARRGRLGDERSLAILVLRHGPHRAVLSLLPPQLHLHSFERVQLDSIDCTE